MKKALPVIIIALLLLTLAIVEITYVNNIVTDMDREVGQLVTLYEENEDDITIILPHLDKVKDKWKKNEAKLCYIFNHRDMSMITDSLSKLSSYTRVNDYEDAYTEVRLLKEYTEKSPRIMSFNIHNVL